jgi:hypothetical protein
LGTRPDKRRHGGALMAAFVSVTLVTAETTARAEPCTATTTLAGPSALTRAIARGLEAHGVSVGRPGTCAAHRVDARVTPTSSSRGLKLHIEDGFGRTSERVLSDPDTAVSLAVSLIESWAVEEDSDLLARPTPVADSSPAGLTAADPTTTFADRLFYGGVASTFGSDESIGGAAVVGGCARVGGSCLGAELIGWRDLGLIGDTGIEGTTRTAVDVFATAALPFATERWLLMPAVGLGAGWVRTHAPAKDADTPAGTTNTFGVRGAVSVMAGVSLSKHVMLALDLGGTLAPTARRGTDDQRGTPSLPDEPRFSGRAGITCVVSP